MNTFNIINPIDNCIDDIDTLSDFSAMSSISESDSEYNFSDSDNKLAQFNKDISELLDERNTLVQSTKNINKYCDIETDYYSTNINNNIEINNNINISDDLYKKNTETGLFLLDEDETHNTIIKRIPVQLSDGTFTTVHERDEIRKETDMIKPEPFRLIMLKMYDNCQFCSNPKGGSYCHYINYYFGFVSCEECYTKGEMAITEWHNINAFGRVKHLKDKNIKIQRSQINPITGTDIEDGWMLENPVVLIKEGVEFIKCVTIDKAFERYCEIDTILKLNS